MMPLSGSGLSAALEPVIESKIRENYSITPGFGDAEIKKFAKALAEAIGPTVVTHIVSNALVTGTVTSGSGAGGNVTGTVS